MGAGRGRAELAAQLGKEAGERRLCRGSELPDAGPSRPLRCADRSRRSRSVVRSLAGRVIDLFNCAVGCRRRCADSFQAPAPPSEARSPRTISETTAMITMLEPAASALRRRARAAAWCQVNQCSNEGVARRMDHAFQQHQAEGVHRRFSP